MIVKVQVETLENWERPHILQVGVSVVVNGRETVWSTTVPVDEFQSRFDACLRYAADQIRATYALPPNTLGSKGTFTKGGNP